MFGLVILFLPGLIYECFFLFLSINTSFYLNSTNTELEFDYMNTDLNLTDLYFYFILFYNLINLGSDKWRRCC